MDKYRKLAELLKARNQSGDIFIHATISKITGDTCSVKVGELELSDVRLRATTASGDDKLLITPKEGSNVILGANAGDLRELVVMKVDDPAKIYYRHKDLKIEIDGDTGKITINGGKLGGLIKIKDLVDKVNKIEDDINTLKQDFSTWVPVPNDGGAALKTASASWAGQQIQKTQVDDIEDKKVTH